MNAVEIASELKKEIERLDQARHILLGRQESESTEVSGTSIRLMPHNPRRKKHTMSAEGRRRVSDAQKARWAKLRKDHKKAA